MKNILYHNSKIEIRKSPIHGWGVFATDNINQGEILEEVPFLTIPMDPNESSSLFIDYRFNFPQGSPSKEQVIPFGSACIYNHSDTNNAVWYTDNDERIFIFVAILNIKKDAEIFTSYGGENYWNDGRNHIKVK